MKRKYKFYGSDGNGGFIENVTKGEYGSMKEALKEVNKKVHRCLKLEVV